MLRNRNRKLLTKGVQLNQIEYYSRQNTHTHTHTIERNIISTEFDNVTQMYTNCEGQEIVQKIFVNKFFQSFADNMIFNSIV